jgi:hypothetical protein
MKIVTAIDPETLNKMYDELTKALRKVRDDLTGSEAVKDMNYIRAKTDNKKPNKKESEKVFRAINRMLATAVKAGLDAHSILEEHREQILANRVPKGN